MQNDFSGSTGALVRLWRLSILEREPNWQIKESIQIQQYSAAFESILSFSPEKSKTKSSCKSLCTYYPKTSVL